MGIVSDGEKKPAVNRNLVGVLTLLCLGAAVGLWIYAPEESSRFELLQAAFVRVGCLLAAFWIALPGGGRAAAWENLSPGALIGILLAIVGVAVRPKVAVPILIVLVVIGFVLRPRKKPRGRR